MEDLFMNLTSCYLFMSPGPPSQSLALPSFLSLASVSARNAARCHRAVLRGTMGSCLVLSVLQKPACVCCKHQGEKYSHSLKIRMERNLQEEKRKTKQQQQQHK